jgi:hypothetical protein
MPLPKPLSDAWPLMATAMASTARPRTTHLSNDFMAAGGAAGLAGRQDNGEGVHTHQPFTVCFNRFHHSNKS